MIETAADVRRLLAGLTLTDKAKRTILAVYGIDEQTPDETPVDQGKPKEAPQA